jgi:predicted TIM-barrel fold metal-dependent hydrolase
MAGHPSDTKFGRFAPPEPDWLNRAEPEAVLDPNLPIVDAHHHLWDRRRPGGLHQRYLLDEFLADAASGHNIMASVFIETEAMYKSTGPEAFRPVGEVEFVNGIAAMAASGQYGPTRVAAGIVGFADLTGDRAGDVLEAMIAAGGGRFRGIRQSANWDADPTIGNGKGATADLYSSAAFREGFKRLAALGLSLDAWVFHPHLSEVVGLARRFPEANIVMGHIGGPLGYGVYRGRQQEIFATWRQSMTTLAQCDNVTVKLGGTAMRLAAIDYGNLPRPPTSHELATAWAPYFDVCIELFGADRCMFESNFPVESLLGSYRTLWNSFKRIAAGASTSEKAALFSGTASRVYRLDDA